MATERAVIGPGSVVTWSDAQISTEVDGAYVVMNAERNEFYDLNSTATAVWSMIEQPITVRQVCVGMVDRFMVDTDICEREVIAVLQRLNEQGMVAVIAQAS